VVVPPDLMPIEVAESRLEPKLLG